MARTRLNPCLAKIHRTYTVEETARLYGLNRNTVRTWLKSGDLEALDRSRPLLIHGLSLRAFLAKRRASTKRPCPPGTLYCFRCRAPRPPALGMADYVARPSGAGDLKAFCAVCGTLMNRRTRSDRLGTVLPGIEVRVTQAAPRLADSPAPSVKLTSEPDPTT